MSTKCQNGRSPVPAQTKKWVCSRWLAEIAGSNPAEVGHELLSLVGVVCCQVVCGADGTGHHPHRTHDLRSGCQDHHPSKNLVQKIICCNSTCNAPDNGRMYPRHVELRMHQ